MTAATPINPAAFTNGDMTESTMQISLAKQHLSQPTNTWIRKKRKEEKRKREKEREREREREKKKRERERKKGREKESEKGRARKEERERKSEKEREKEERERKRERKRGRERGKGKERKGKERKGKEKETSGVSNFPLYLLGCSFVVVLRLRYVPPDRWLLPFSSVPECLFPGTCGDLFVFTGRAGSGSMRLGLDPRESPQFREHLRSGCTSGALAAKFGLGVAVPCLFSVTRSGECDVFV